MLDVDFFFFFINLVREWLFPCLEFSPPLLENGEGGLIICRERERERERKRKRKRKRKKKAREREKELERERKRKSERKREMNE